MKAILHRLAVTVAAAIMLLFFLGVIAAALPLVPLFMVAYLIGGSAWIYGHLGNFGEALDQAANVVFLDGHPKETISSHVGRFYQTIEGNPLTGAAPTDPTRPMPWQCRFIKAVTDEGQPNHVYLAIEPWAIDQQVPL